MKIELWSSTVACVPHRRGQTVAPRFWANQYPVLARLRTCAGRRLAVSLATTLARRRALGQVGRTRRRRRSLGILAHPVHHVTKRPLRGDFHPALGHPDLELRDVPQLSFDGPHATLPVPAEEVGDSRVAPEQVRVALKHGQAGRHRQHRSLVGGVAPTVHRSREQAPAPRRFRASLDVACQGDDPIPSQDREDPPPSCTPWLGGTCCCRLQLQWPPSAGWTGHEPQLQWLARGHIPTGSSP